MYDLIYMWSKKNPIRYKEQIGDYQNFECGSGEMVEGSQKVQTFIYKVKCVGDIIYSILTILLLLSSVSYI